MLGYTLACAGSCILCLLWVCTTLYRYASGGGKESGEYYRWLIHLVDYHGHMQVCCCGNHHHHHHCLPHRHPLFSPSSSDKYHYPLFSPPSSFTQHPFFSLFFSYTPTQPQVNSPTHDPFSSLFLFLPHTHHHNHRLTLPASFDTRHTCVFPEPTSAKWTLPSFPLSRSSTSPPTTSPNCACTSSVFSYSFFPFLFLSLSLMYFIFFFIGFSCFNNVTKLIQTLHTHTLTMDFPHTHAHTDPVYPRWNTSLSFPQQETQS